MFAIRNERESFLRVRSILRFNGSSINRNDIVLVKIRTLVFHFHSIFIQIIDTNFSSRIIDRKLGYY